MQLLNQLKRVNYLYLDRFTGNPIHPISEKIVPQSDIPGEITSKTQPFTKSTLIYGKTRIEKYS